jgi:hypothetical protein
MLNRCNRPRVTNFCPECDGERCGGTETTEFNHQINGTLPIKNPKTAPEKQTKTPRENYPARKMPYKKCSKNCLPENAKVEHHCHDCDIHMSQKPKKTVVNAAPTRKKKKTSGR